MDKKQRKKNRTKGVDFERAVREDLTENGWIVCKFDNNIELTEYNDIAKGVNLKDYYGRLVQAKKSFNPFTKRLGYGNGFPDFMCIKSFIPINDIWPRRIYEVIGCEVKMRGYLSKEEKEKCRWLLDNKIFSKILIAKKGKKGIEYNKFIVSQDAEEETNPGLS